MNGAMAGGGRRRAFRQMLLPALLLVTAAALAAQDAPEDVTASLPRPGRLVAEAAPNDDGSHITLRWPASVKDTESIRYVLYLSRRPGWRPFRCKVIGG